MHSKASLLEFSLNVIATFDSASANNLSLIFVDVTSLPSVPEKGELFTVIVTVAVLLSKEPSLET